MDSRTPRFGIFILCYNVERHIRSVLESIHSTVYNRVESIVVIDNNSSDRTIEEAASAIAKRRMLKAKILKNTKNYGYGGSHKVAFDYLKKAGVDYAVLFHGDGQGDAESLLQLLDECKNGNYDFVIGSRFLEAERLDKEYSALRKLANLFFVTLQRCVTGMKITDPGSGEVAYRLKFLDQFPYHQLTDEFHFTPQLLLFCAKSQVKIKEFPIRWGKVDVSSVNIWRHGWLMLQMLLSYRLKGIKMDKEKKSAQYESQLVYDGACDANS